MGYKTGGGLLKEGEDLYLRTDSGLYIFYLQSFQNKFVKMFLYLWGKEI